MVTAAHWFTGISLHLDSCVSGWWKYAYFKNKMPVFRGRERVCGIWHSVQWLEGGVRCPLSLSAFFLWDKASHWTWSWGFQLDLKPEIPGDLFSPPCSLWGMGQGYGRSGSQVCKDRAHLLSVMGSRLCSLGLHSQGSNPPSSLSPF